MDQTRHRHVTPVGSLDSNPLARLRVPKPVNRYEYVKSRCEGLRVLDLGAYDETEVDRTQHGSWRWLHADIASVAKEVLGVDASPKLRDSGGVDTHVGTRIVYGTVENLDDVIADFQPDLIVAGELIEHTQDTLGWLTRIGQIRPGTPILATTPNTTSILNSMLAVLGRESTHPDHLHVYSYRTLATLSSRVPMANVTIRPYYYDPHLFYGKMPRYASPLITGFDRLFLRPVQYLFPLMSIGWVLEGSLGES